MLPRRTRGARVARSGHDTYTAARTHASYIHTYRPGHGASTKSRLFGVSLVGEAKLGASLVHYEHLPLSAASPILASPLIGLGKEGGSKDHQKRLDFHLTNKLHVKSTYVRPDDPVNNFPGFTFSLFPVTARDQELWPATPASQHC
jgi:hypothetical protein